MWLSRHFRETLLTVLGLACLLLLAPLFPPEIHRTERMRAAPDTPATIASIQTGVMDVPHRVRAVTGADGRPYDVKVVVTYFRPKANEGDPVKVRVDPLDPTFVEWPDSNSRPLWVMYTGWIGFLVGGGLMLLAALVILVRSGRDLYGY